MSITCLMKLQGVNKKGYLSLISTCSFTWHVVYLLQTRGIFTSVVKHLFHACNDYLLFYVLAITLCQLSCFFACFFHWINFWILVLSSNRDIVNQFWFEFWLLLMTIVLQMRHIRTCY